MRLSFVVEEDKSEIHKYFFVCFLMWFLTKAILNNMKVGSNKFNTNWQSSVQFLRTVNKTTSLYQSYWMKFGAVEEWNMKTKVKYFLNSVLFQYNVRVMG